MLIYNIYVISSVYVIHSLYVIAVYWYYTLILYIDIIQCFIDIIKQIVEKMQVI